jgi:putative NADH-flavin reductase
MKIAIIGATGRVGRLVLEKAATMGHDVTAVARDASRLASEVRSITTNLASADQSALRRAIDGADAVLSCLGSTSSAEVGIAATGTAAIVEAMQSVGASRLVAISASPVATLPTPDRPEPTRDPGEGFLTRTVAVPLMKRVFGRTYADLAAMETVIRSSGLDWTIMRPPRLTDGQSVNYRIAIGHNVPHGNSISRRALAHAMLNVLKDPATIRNPVGVAE